MTSVNDKIIIVTGAAQGLGKAFAMSLSNAGAKLVLADILKEKLADNVSKIKSSGGDCIGIPTDVTNKMQVQEMVAAATQKYGRIDALVNNAAIYYGLRFQPFQEISEEDWNRVMNVNLKGTFLCCQSVFPQMRRQGKGKIINIASATFFSGVPYFAHYVASKGGIVGLSRALARELGEFGITVNVLAPGYTLTDASIQMAPNQEFKQGIAARRALRRDEQPEDVAGTLLYLCSDASDFLTGQTIVVDGGGALH